jgi:hypothetical protein
VWVYPDGARIGRCSTQPQLRHCIRGRRPRAGAHHAADLGKFRVAPAAHGAWCRTRPARSLSTGAAASVKDYPQSVMGKLAVFDPATNVGDACPPPPARTACPSRDKSSSRSRDAPARPATCPCAGRAGRGRSGNGRCGDACLALRPSTIPGSHSWDRQVSTQLWPPQLRVRTTPNSGHHSDGPEHVHKPGPHILEQNFHRSQGGHTLTSVARRSRKSCLASKPIPGICGGVAIPSEMVVSSP